MAFVRILGWVFAAALVLTFGLHGRDSAAPLSATAAPTVPSPAYAMDALPQPLPSTSVVSQPRHVRDLLTPTTTLSGVPLIAGKQTCASAPGGLQASHVRPPTFPLLI
jgi:hypothetical protein